MPVSFPGYGNIPPVRRWETGVLPGGSSALRTAVTRGQRSAQALFTPASSFVTAAGYGLMPRADRGSVVSVMDGSSGGHVSGLGGLRGIFSTDDSEACQANLKDTRNQIMLRLPRLSRGIQVTAQSLLDSTQANVTNKGCIENMNILRQVLDMAIADLRSQVAAPGATSSSGTAPAAAALKELESIKNPTMRYLGISIAAVGGLALIGIVVLAARKR